MLTRLMPFVNEIFGFCRLHLHKPSTMIGYKLDRENDIREIIEMIISTKGRYALRVMLNLAEREGEDRYIPLKEIAEREEISEKYLEAIVKLLVSKNLLIGLRGKGGGYRLSKDPKDYSVGEILRTTEGDLNVVACLADTADPCPHLSTCKTVPMWSKLDRMVNDFFDGISIADLMNPQEEGAV